MTPADLIALLLALLFGFGAWTWLTRRYDLRRANFRKERIPAIAGLTFLLGGEFFYACEWLWRLEARLGPSLASVYFLVVLGFGGLGLFDDLRGDRSVGGFRGHLGALRRGRLTTGAVKLIGGGILSLVAGFLIAAPHYGWGLVSALLIALSANTLNLLDLRPGRCLFGFLMGAGALLILLACQHSSLVGFLLWPAVAFALILYPLDAGGRAMLGDTGSNAFGAVLGVSAAVFLPFWGQVVVMLLLGAFQWWCEGHSLSRTIEQTPWLRRLDSKIGVR